MADDPASPRPRGPSPTAWALIAIGCLALALALWISAQNASLQPNPARHHMRTTVGAMIFSGMGASILAGLALRIDPGKVVGGFVILWFGWMFARKNGWL